MKGKAELHCNIEMTKMHGKEKVKDFRKVRKPRGLTVEENDNEIRLILDGKKVEEENMQVTCNAFEGWAVAAQACILNEESNKKVVLDVKPGVHYDQDPEKTKNEGHLARFLYRAMRFDEQYDWFMLSEELSKEVKEFRHFLESGVFINNIATCDAGNTNREEDENAIEDILSKGNTLKTVLSDVVDVGNNDVFRQLPVGLFKDEVGKENRIFTGGKSAIDLWTYNNNEISIVELKYKNRMIGIITEIFFYANYMYDLVTQNDRFIMNTTPNKTPARGYEKLTVKGFDTVNGIMLADKTGFHPLVNEKGLEILSNGSNPKIKYYMAKYGFKGEVYRLC